MVVKDAAAAAVECYAVSDGQTGNADGDGVGDMKHAVQPIVVQGQICRAGTGNRDTLVDDQFSAAVQSDIVERAIEVDRVAVIGVHERLV